MLVCCCGTSILFWFLQPSPEKCVGYSYSTSIIILVFMLVCCATILLSYTIYTGIWYTPTILPYIYIVSFFFFFKLSNHNTVVTFEKFPPLSRGFFLWLLEKQLYIYIRYLCRISGVATKKIIPELHMNIPIIREEPGGDVVLGVEPFPYYPTAALTT